MTNFEEIQYSLTGKRPKNYEFDSSGNRIIISDEEDRWIFRLLIRMLIFLLLLLLLRFFGFLPSSWSEFAQTLQLNRVSQSNTISQGATNQGTNTNSNNSGSGSNLGGSNNSDGTLVFGSGDTSTNGLAGSSTTNGVAGAQGLQGPKGDTGPQGPAGPAGPQGPAGANGQGGGASVSSGQGSNSIGACDDSVDIGLRSYFTGSAFKLDRILISNVSTNCNGLDLTVILMDATSPNPNELVSVNIPSVTVTSGVITINRTSYPSIANVVSNQIASVAFEIAE